MQTHSVSASQSQLTVLGLGDMGTALAAAFLKQGHKVTVWNRTASKADSLIAKGATLAPDVARAIAASPLVVVCVLDYAVLRTLLTPVAESLAGRTLVNLTTGSPKDARAMSAWLSGLGVQYLDGGIMATPSMVGKPDSVILYSGPEALFQAQLTNLAALGATQWVGADPGLASLQDMVLLSAMYGVFSGFFHAVSLGASEGIRPSEAMAAIGPFLQIVLTFLPSYAAQMEAGDYTLGVEANLGMQTVSLGHIVRASQEQGIRPDLLMPLLELFRERTAGGFAHEDISGVVELIQSPIR